MKYFELLMRLARTTLVWVAVMCTATEFALADHETAEDLQASEVLAPELVSGERFKVDERVKNDGYLNYYTIRSEYGDFETAGTAMLRMRIREVEALAELDELSHTEVFASAMVNAGVQQIVSVRKLVMNPIEAVKGLPSGIGRMFNRYSRQSKESVATAKDYDEASERMAGTEIDLMFADILCGGGTGTDRGVRHLLDPVRPGPRRQSQRHLGQHREHRPGRHPRHHGTQAHRAPVEGKRREVP